MKEQQFWQELFGADFFAAVMYKPGGSRGIFSGHGVRCDTRCKT